MPLLSRNTSYTRKTLKRTSLGPCTITRTPYLFTSSPPSSLGQHNCALCSRQSRRAKVAFKDLPCTSFFHTKQLCDIGYNNNGTTALAILKLDDLWNWPDTKWIQAGKQNDNFQATTPKLLYFLIVGSQRFGGELLDHFWKQLGTCDEKLKENIERLKEEDFVSAQKSLEVLFQGLVPKNVNFKPVIDMAAEFFTHLGVAFMNPGGRKSGTSTAFSVSERVNEETDELLQRVSEEGSFEKRNQELLKALSFKRDGNFCTLTGTEFVPFDDAGIDPAFTYIIPNSVYGKPDTLKCIAMFAGAAIRDDVVSHLNSISNVMNMEQNAHISYNQLKWGIEAKEEGGEVRYLFRMVPTNPNSRAPGYIALREGDEIQFGKGSEGKKLNKGPVPGLCNLWLAVARVLKGRGCVALLRIKRSGQPQDTVPRSNVSSGVNTHRKHRIKFFWSSIVMFSDFATRKVGVVEGSNTI